MKLTWILIVMVIVFLFAGVATEGVPVYCMATCEQVYALESRIETLEEALHDIKDIFNEFSWQAFTYHRGVEMRQAFVQKYVFAETREAMKK